MFKWLKGFIPKSAPNGSQEVLAKEIRAIMSFFDADVVSFWAAMVKRKVDVTPLLHLADGVSRRKAVVEFLLEKEWIPKHRYEYLMRQEEMVVKIEHWYTNGDFLL